MSFILLALVAHFGNGLVFIVDKGLLSAGGKISEPLRLAFYSGLVSAAAIVLLPFAWAAPNGFVLTWSTVAGCLFIAALWFFFSALKDDEPSRVVPLIGSAVPLWTLLIATTLLGESLSGRHLLAICFLVGGGLVLSLRLRQARGLSGKTIGHIVLGGAAFAAYFVVVKYIYDNFTPFLAAFAYSRVMVGVAALVVLGPLVLWASPAQRRKKVSQGRRNQSFTAVAFFGSKVLSTGAFLLQNYAISIGSVTIVNALQGTQYLFVLLLAAAVSIWFPKLFKEELTRVALSQKLSGIILVSIGLGLLL